MSGRRAFFVPVTANWFTTRKSLFAGVAKSINCTKSVSFVPSALVYSIFTPSVSIR